MNDLRIAAPVFLLLVLCCAVEASSTEGASARRGEGGASQPADESAEESRPFFPELDIYFPEGKLDLRLSRLIKNALFEGQVKYNFVKGDITAFLRYRYYGYRTIYQLGVFDALEFEDVEDFDNDFERERGILLFTSWPHDYHNRTFLLAEIDHLTSSKEELQFNNDRTNTFIRFGFQRGTADDTRSNSIVGETRARTENLFTAHRKIGPGQAGFTAALTYGFDFAGGNFSYLKIEVEGLKRFNLTPRSFVVARVHAGTFLHKEMVRDGPDVEEWDKYSIPLAELFRLDGRENLKGIDEKLRGTEELHSTVELFVPWFLNRSFHFLWVDWENYYWILYGGVGTTGYDRQVYTDWDGYYPDVGLGFEASFKLRGYTFFLSGLAATALQDGGGVKTRLSIKSYH
ncbi:MAG: hypothetical protein GY856_44150 [bacterium]|nr:hypothetical protein [bacterium]